MAKLSKTEILDKLKSAIIDGDRDLATDCAKQVVDLNLSIVEAIDAMSGAMNTVGKKFENNEIFVSDMITTANAMKGTLEIFTPQIEKVGGKIRNPGTIVIGSVKGDVHDIGKNIVAAMLTGANFQVYDLGVDVPSDKFIEKAKAAKADIVAASAYMTTTTPELKALSEDLQKSGIRGQVKYLIGGAAVDPKHVEWSGADAYAVSAPEAVKVTKQLIKKSED